MWRMAIAVLLFVLFFKSSAVFGVQHCYECQMNFSSDDQSCLTQPSNIVTCENVCFINRTEYLDTGKFYSLSRGCSNIWSTVSEVEGFKHIIKICNSELCNDGDGNLSTSINSTTEGTTGDTGSSISAIAPAVLICFSITMMAVHSY